MVRDLCKSNATLYRSLMLCLWVLLPHTGLVSAQEAEKASADTQTEQVRQAIEEKIAAREKNSEKLQSAFASGRVEFLLRQPGDTKPTVLLDAGLQIFTKGTKYRVHLTYDARLEENPNYQGPLDEINPKWIETDILERTVIFDGEKIYSLAFDKQRQCEGTIYFGFAKMAVMRLAGYPFEDPLRLWEQAVSLEGLDLTQTKISPFQSKGMLGIMQKNTYRMQFLFLDDFEYDLRRVSSYRLGESQPFRDYTLKWDSSNGVHYVKRFSNTTTSAHGDTGSQAQIARTLSVEFDQFKSNITMPQDAFELRSASVPAGSRFRDKRSTVEGGPQRLVFDGKELLPQ